MCNGWISSRQYRKKQYDPKANRNSDDPCKGMYRRYRMPSCSHITSLRRWSYVSFLEETEQCTRWTIRDSNTGMGKGAFYKTSRPTMGPHRSSYSMDTDSLFPRA